MKMIHDIVADEILDQLDTSLAFCEVSEPVEGETATTQEVTLCCLRWLKLYMAFYVGEIKYTVTALEGNVATVTLPEGADPLTVDTVARLQVPLLFNGTLSNTQLEWSEYSLDEREKLPFIWLVSPTSETFQPLDSGLDRIAALKLWFVHWSDWSELNEVRQDEALQPLFNFIEEFVDTINRNTLAFLGFDSFNLRDFPKFGTVNQQGTEKALFNTTLSAVEMDISLKIFRKLCEKC